MEPIRVLYVIGGGEFGGAEQHLLSLVKALPRERLAPHIAVFYSAGFADRVQAAGAPVTVLRPSGLRGLYGYTALQTLIQQFDPQIIHTHGVRANFLGRIAARRSHSSAKLVTTVHSILALDYPVAWKRWLFQQFERYTERMVDRFILVSHAMRETFVAGGHNPATLQVIHNAIELPEQDETAAHNAAFAPAQSNSLRTELGLGEDDVLVGTVARLHLVKGHRFLLEAAQRVCADNPAVHFVWIGDGELRQSLQEEARQLGLERHIHFLGFRNDVTDLLAQLDMFVLPSLSEGLSVALLEAMVRGVPVIATRVGGNPEVIARPEEGLLVPPGDAQAVETAIRALVRNPEAARQMGAAGREAVMTRFSYNRLVKEVEAVYEELLGNG